MPGRPGRKARQLAAQIELGVGGTNPLFRERVLGETISRPRVITPPTPRGIAVTKKNMQQQRRTSQQETSLEAFRANMSGIIQHSGQNTSRNMGLRNAGKRAPDKEAEQKQKKREKALLSLMSEMDGMMEEPSLKDRIDAVNTHFKLRSMGFKIAEEIHKVTFTNPENKQLIVDLLTHLNPDDADAYEKGEITFVDLMFHPESPYKIWTYGG